MRSLRFGLGMRIFSGFGILVLLLLGIALSGSYGLFVVGGEVGKMDAIAGSLRRVQETTYRLEVVRRGLNRFRLDADEAALRDAINAETRAVELLEQLAAGATSDQKSALYHSVAANLRSLAKKRERFVTLLRAAVQERKVLSDIDDTMTVAATNLADAAGASKNPADWVPGHAVRIAFLSAELASSRFLASPEGDAALADAFRKEAGLAQGSLTAEIYVGSTDVKTLVPPVQTLLNQYIASFNKYAAAMLEGASLYDTQIRPEIHNLQTLLATAQDSLSSGFDQTSNAANDVATGALHKQIAMSGGATIAGLVLALLLARAIIRPIRSMTEAMARLAAGDTETDVPARGNTDEIGAMARAVEVFRLHAIENTRLAREREHDRAEKDRHQAAMDRHTEDFGTSIAGVMQRFIASANAVRQAASQATDGARRTHERISDTMQGAAASARDLGSVAASAEEVAASINEISKQVSHVTASVQAAVGRATETDVKVASLSEAANRIGEVVHLITNIAGQTNLLALNATIEAARAGEAGKGFAVVAGEVKALAAQTARATEQIGAQVVAIRGATDGAVTAVREVGAAIGAVETVATAIAAAVEEQAAATREITNSVQLVTTTTSSAADAMREVLAIAESTDETNVSAVQAADEVGETAGTLRSEMADFLAALTRGNESERRLYERIPGEGAQVSVRMGSRPAAGATIKDISRGGITILLDCDDQLGMDTEFCLPGGGSVKARIVRIEDGMTSFAFRQDAASLSQIDRAMEIIGQGGAVKAA